jgi:hypothetical protein
MRLSQEALFIRHCSFLIVYREKAVLMADELTIGKMLNEQ